MGRELGNCCDVPADVYAVEHEYGGSDWVELPESGMAL